MKNKKIFLFLFVLFFLVSLSIVIGKVVATSETDTVSATVTAQSISVNVDNASVAFGTIGVGSSADTTSNGVNDTSTATNDGNITEKLNIKAGNSTNWTLAASPGSEEYAMRFCTASCDTSPTWTAIGIHPSYATLIASVGVGITQPFDLLVKAPSGTTNFGEQTITVTVQAATP